MARKTLERLEETKALAKRAFVSAKAAAEEGEGRKRQAVADACPVYVVEMGKEEEKEEGKNGVEEEEGEEEVVVEEEEGREEDEEEVGAMRKCLDTQRLCGIYTPQVVQIGG